MVMRMSKDYIWSEDSALVDGLLVINHDGPRIGLDEFGCRYRTYASKGDMDDMNTLVKGICYAYSAVKPEGEVARSRTVHVVWRCKPEISTTDGETFTYCRFTIYTQDEYEVFWGNRAFLDARNDR